MEEVGVARAAHQPELHVVLADGDQLLANFILSLAVLPGSQRPGQGE